MPICSSGGPRVPPAGVRDVGRGSRTLAIRARFLVSGWGTVWLLSHHESETALTSLHRALAAADATDADDAEADGADMQAGMGE
ncbi:hypothetical protein GCM10009736_10460 [Actinomadura bangladeshensis]